MVDSFDEEEEEEKYPEEPNSVGTGPDYVSSKEGSIQVEPNVANTFTDVKNLITGSDAEVNTQVI